MTSNAQRDADDLKRTREEEDTIHEREGKKAKGDDEDDDDMDMDADSDDGEHVLCSRRCSSRRSLYPSIQRRDLSREDPASFEDRRRDHRGRGRRL